jgi:hypothetical protein
MGLIADFLGTLRPSFRIGHATLDASALTAARTYTLPDASGVPSLVGHQHPNGLPPAGAAQALLAKASASDYDTAWTSAPTLTGLTVNGAVVVDGYERRIKANFSEYTPSYRTLFQTSLADRRTVLGMIPSGTGNESAFMGFNGSDPDNAGMIAFGITPGECYLQSYTWGTGELLPLTLYYGSSPRMKMASDGLWAMDTFKSFKGYQQFDLSTYSLGLSQFVDATDVYFDAKQGGAKFYWRTSGAGNILTLNTGDSKATFSGEIVAAGLTVNGNVVIGGERKIQADFTSWPTQTVFQSSVANGQTNICAMPNGTGDGSILMALSSPTIATAYYTQFGYNAALGSFITASKVDTGAHAPLRLNVSRLTGTWSNASIKDRIAFQASALGDGYTAIGILPPASGSASYLQVCNNSDADHSAVMNVYADAATCGLYSTSTGGVSFLPMTFTAPSLKLEGVRNLYIDSPDTIANGFVFRSAAANTYTRVRTAPNGSGGTAGSGSGFLASSHSDADNAGYLHLASLPGYGFIESGKVGSGTAYPLLLRAGPTEIQMNQDGGIDLRGTLRIAGGQTVKGNQEFLDVTTGAVNFRQFGVNGIMYSDLLNGKRWFIRDGNSGVGYMDLYPAAGYCSFSLPLFARPKNYYGVGDGYAWVNADGRFAGFVWNNSIGGIDTYVDQTLVHFAYTASDKRLKGRIASLPSTEAAVRALRPVRFTWKNDGSNTLFPQASQAKFNVGFVAEEVELLVPAAVFGAKDAVDSEGHPIYQQLDALPLIATLTKALQEAFAKIDVLSSANTALAGRVKALEDANTALTARVKAQEDANTAILGRLAAAGIP